MLSLFPTPEDVMMHLKPLLWWNEVIHVDELLSDVSLFNADRWSLIQGPGRDCLGGLSLRMPIAN